MMPDIPHPSMKEGRPWEETPQQHRYIQKVSIKARSKTRNDENEKTQEFKGHRVMGAGQSQGLKYG